MNILFICKQNIMRSRTAENIYASNSLHNAKSAGISQNAKNRITSELIKWAELIFVMEEAQEIFIREEFPQELEHREIIILDIPNNYYFMQPELVELIRTKVTHYLEA